MAPARQRINQHLLKSLGTKDLVKSDAKLMSEISPQVSLLHSSVFLLLLFSLNLEAGEKIQQLRALADLGEALN